MTDQVQKHETSVKETLTSIMISFIVALVFRGFVVEGFQIPTGSMGPTLLGAHVDVHSEITGYDWPLEPWQNFPGTTAPVKDQVGIDPTDPIASIALPAKNYTRRSGDRVFVFKYLEPFFGPSRWDVTVFKVPVKTAENYIKRMIGVANEQLALVDGDVFTRAVEENPSGWSEPGWLIERKPERVQRAVWQTIFDSSYAPTGTVSYRSPWQADTGGWAGLDAGPSYAFTGSTPTSLTWTNRAHRLDDYLPFNEIPGIGQSWDRRGGMPTYPVSDVAFAFGFEPDADATTSTVSVALGARGHEFPATIIRDTSTTTAIVDMREAGDEGAWQQLELVQLTGLALKPGRVTNIEFWHVDQAVWLFADGELVAGGPDKGAYDWDIAQRIAASTGRDLAEALDADTDGRIKLTPPDLYIAPTLQVSFAGSAFDLHRVRVKRDLFYRPNTYGRTEWDGDPRTAMGRPALATHPASPLVLGPDEFFLCGDNSARSLDGRLWGVAHPTILDRFDSRPGTVPRDLLIGKAFIVYFPSPHRRFGLPILDFGKNRWIW